MPAESIIALIAIMGLFAFFSAVLGWASHNAPATFADAAPGRSEPAQPPYGRPAMVGAH